MTKSVPFIFLGKKDTLKDDFNHDSVISTYLDLIRESGQYSIPNFLRGLINSLSIDNKTFSFEGYELKYTHESPSIGFKECKTTQSTYACDIIVKYKVHGENSQVQDAECVALTLPMPTVRNSFIINGTEYTLITRMDRNLNIFTDVNKDNSLSILREEPLHNINIRFSGDVFAKGHIPCSFKLNFYQMSDGKQYLGVSVVSLAATLLKKYNQEPESPDHIIDITFELAESDFGTLKDNPVMEILSNINWVENNLQQIFSTVFNIQGNISTIELIPQIFDHLRRHYNTEDAPTIYGRESIHFKVINPPVKWIYEEATKAIKKSVVKTFNDFASVLFSNSWKSFSKCFLQSEFSQWMDDNNPVSEGSHKRRVTYNIDNPTDNDRLYHSSYQNIICPIETPESGNIGLSLNFSCSYGNDIQGDFGMLSLPTSLIPFVDKNDANRCLMGSNMLKQSLPLKNSTFSKVITENYLNLGRNHWSNVKSPVSGHVTHVDEDKIIVHSNGIDYRVDIFTNIQSNKHTNYTTYPVVKVGDQVEKGDSVACSRFFKKQIYTPSVPLLACYLPYFGYNFEDSIVISDRVVKEDILTSVWHENITLNLTEQFLSTSNFCKDYAIDETKWLVDINTLKELIGKKFKKGEPIIHYFVKQNSINDFMLSDLNGYPESQLILEKVFCQQTELTIDNIYLVKDGINLPFTEANLKQSQLLVISTHGEDRLEEGDKLSGIHGNKGVCARILPQDQMPKLEDGTPVDIILNTMGIPSRMNMGQLFELWLGLCSETLKKKLQEMGDTKEGRDYLRGFLNLIKEEVNPEEGCTHLDDLIARIDDGVINDILETEVVFLIPQFEKFSSSTTRKLLKYLDLPEDGANTLFIPKSLIPNMEDGFYTENRVAYGYVTILKLEHQVKKKMKLRCCGINNPNPALDEHRGQKSGEMEIWGLEAHHATEVLNEMLNYTSGNYDNKEKLYVGLMAGKSNIPPAKGAQSPVLDTFNHYIKGLGYCLVDKDEGESNDETVEE